MDYLCAFTIGNPSKQNIVTPVEEQRGSCGTFANLLLAFCALEGIKGRPISLLNFPPNNGHAVAELFVDGKWRLYDPTFGVYYARVSPEGTEDVLSFEELRAGGATEKGVLLRRSPGARPEGALFQTQKLYFSPRAYAKAEPAGRTGPEFPMVFPLELNLDGKPLIDSRDFGPRNQGAWIIGGACVNVSQRFTLKGLTPGKSYALEISYSGAGGHLRGRREFKAYAKAVKNADILSGDRYVYSLSGRNEPWRVVFKTGAGEAVILLTHDYRETFYLKAESYKLTGAD